LSLPNGPSGSIRMRLPAPIGISASLITRGSICQGYRGSASTGDGSAAGQTHPGSGPGPAGTSRRSPGGGAAIHAAQPQCHGQQLGLHAVVQAEARVGAFCRWLRPCRATAVVVRCSLGLPPVYALSPPDGRLTLRVRAFRF
jgi:hypothetical protein